MNDLCAEYGYKSINHFGEELCGDHVEIIEREDHSTVIVLADGLGSGVKASILATLTSKIISTMMSEGMALEECVATIAETLPVSKDKGVAYATFTIMQMINNEVLEIIQYENPNVIMLRDGLRYDYPMDEMMIEGKKILKSTILLREDDLFVAMSDGCPYASKDREYNYKWGPDDIAEFMEIMSAAGYTAKNLATLLVEECDKLYGGEPRDDVTACVLKVRKRVPVNVLFGPPANREESDKVMNLFFSKYGKYIVCGGTTASIAARYLRKKIYPASEVPTGGIPPISKIEGIDLVTEGIITMSRVVEYARDYTEENLRYEEWNMQRDAASLISRMLFEEATDINIFAGQAVNPAHQNLNLPIHFSVKMNIVKELEECLKKMGKRVKVSYF